MDKNIIARNFSRYAHLYDAYADIQRETAAELLKGIRGNGLAKILELGCGTGNYTLLLREKFKAARIKALDFSAKMLQEAQEKIKDKSVKFILADAEDLDLRGEFNLITSNASLHWFKDLEKAIFTYKKLLSRGGVILFSIFGALTFQELSRSLETVFGSPLIASSNFLTKERLTEILNKNFKIVTVREIKYTEQFKNIRELLDKIRYSGTRGVGLGGRVYLGKEGLKKLGEAYLEKFGKIIATYQVFFCQARC